MAISKLILNGTTQMDLTSDTVAAASMLSGTTAHKNDGTSVTGSIASKTSSDLSASGKTVTVPAGYYAQQYTKDVATGTEGTPTATKGTVSNHSVSVTPSVTNSAGYISGGTKTGTAVTVSASELVNGTKTISASGTTDVTNYASASVAAGSATTPATTITAQPSISVNSSGLITATNSKTQSVTPTVSAGYVSSGTAGTITVDGSNTSQLTTQAAQTITPTTSDQTIASGKYLTGAQTIKGDANLVAENIAKDVTIFGVTGTHEGGGGGNPEADPNDVNFFDYDGRILYSYSATEFANLSEMPKNPEREGFTSEGWNWSLSDAKSYVAKNVFLQIGQMYKATGSELKVYVRIWNGADKSIILQIPAGSNRVIDWGDNQTEEISGSTRVDKSHTYATHGLYVVKISNVTSLGSSSNGSVGAYCPQSIEAIVFPFLPGYFDDLIFLNDICIPPNTGTAVSYAFGYLKQMNHITIPSNVKSSNFYYANYKSISFAGTDTATSAPSCSNCGLLSHISLPNSITSIPANCFASCSSLTHITIPENVTSIGSSAFSSCNYLQVIRVKPTNPPTIQSNTFSNLPSKCKIIVPSASLATYQSASYWSTHASKMVGE